MMDQFKLQMNWNQEELEQWALAAKQKEEDNLALQRYTRADEVKIKELNLQIEKLTKTLVEKKASLEGETTETKARQVILPSRTRPACVRGACVTLSEVDDGRTLCTD